MSRHSTHTRRELFAWRMAGPCQVGTGVFAHDLALVHYLQRLVNAGELPAPGAHRAAR